MPEPYRFQDGNHAGDAAAVVVTQEDDSFDVEENQFPLQTQEDDGIEGNEDDACIPLDPDQPLSDQIPAGPYLLILNKPVREMLSDPHSIFMSSCAYACPTPWTTCLGPNRSDGTVSIEAGCMFCWMCNHQIQSRIREAGFLQPNHNLFHWGPKNERGGFSWHAYAIGPIFEPGDLQAIHRLVERFEFEGDFKYPTLGPYIHLHIQCG